MKFQDQYFSDNSVPFEYHNGSQIFHSCTDTKWFTMQQHGFAHLFNYIDDLIYSGLPSNTHSSVHFLIKLLEDLGLEIPTRNKCHKYIAHLFGYTIRYGKPDFVHPGPKLN